jgi:hypothetical protein
MWGITPAGSVPFQLNYNCDPITDTCVSEGEGKLGKFGFRVRHLGTYLSHQPALDGIKFASVVNVDASLRDLQLTNAEANGIYDLMTSKGATRAQAQEELRGRNLPEDSWEHTVLVGLPCDPKSVRNFVEAEKARLFGATGGALMMYAMSQENA